jgi:hypothetical protein
MDKFQLRPYRARTKPWMIELDELGARLFNDRGEMVLTLPRAEVPSRVKVPGLWDLSSNIEITGPKEKYVFLGEKAPLKGLRSYQDGVLFQSPDAVRSLHARGVKGLKWAGASFLVWLILALIVALFSQDPLGTNRSVVQRSLTMTYLIVGILLFPALLLKSASACQKAARLEKQQQLGR